MDYKMKKINEVKIYLKNHGKMRARDIRRDLNIPPNLCILRQAEEDGHIISVPPEHGGGGIWYDIPRTEKCICVWYDDAGDAWDHTWIVSIDELDDYDQALSTDTLEVADDYEEAVEKAIGWTKKLKANAYDNNGSGPKKLLFEYASDGEGELL